MSSTTSRIFRLGSAALIAASGVAAQVSAPWTDPVTGISFSTTQHESGFTWGVATPKTITTDFIAFMAFPITEGGGWGGISLGQGGKMAGTALVVAWPNAGSVVAGFREADGYSNPGSLTGSQQLVPIPKGTYTNATHTSLTFLCKDCIDATLTFAPSANITVMGFAMNTEPPTTPSDPNSELAFHSSFGQAGMDIPASMSADFDTWAAMASGGSSGNSSSTDTGSSTASSTDSSTATSTDSSTDTTTATSTDSSTPTDTSTDSSTDTSTDSSTDTATSTDSSTDSSTPTSTDSSTDSSTPTSTSTCAAKRKRAAKLRLRK